MMDSRTMLLIRSLVEEIEYMTRKLETADLKVTSEVVLALEEAKERLQEVYLDQIQEESELKMACANEGRN